MRTLLAFCALFSIVVAGCGGGGTSITIDTSYDGLGTTLPSTDAAIVIDHRHAYAAAALIRTIWLDQGRTQKAVFGHQSVGTNILEGMESLEGHSGRYNVNVTTYPTSNASGCVAQFSVGTNGDPQGKIDDFVAKVNSGDMADATVAMFKFCYVDFTDSTDAAALFTSYRTAMNSLEIAHPGIKLVYCTVPITTTFMQSRQDFNVLVRNYCLANGKPLYDIASIEAYDPNDNAVGGSRPVLYAGYTSDESHPNTAAGELRLARAWWWLMARLSGWDGK